MYSYSSQTRLACTRFPWKCRRLRFESRHLSPPRAFIAQSRRGQLSNASKDDDFELERQHHPLLQRRVYDDCTCRAPAPWPRSRSSGKVLEGPGKPDPAEGVAVGGAVGLGFVSFRCAPPRPVICWPRACRRGRIGIL